MSKTKILQAGPLPPPIGGMAIYMKNLEEFESDRYELTFFDTTTNSTNKFVKALFNVISIFHFIVKLLLSNAQIVHIHTAGYGSFSKSQIFLRIVKFFKRQCILHIHSGMFIDFYKDSSPSKQKSILSTLNAADQVVVLSESWKDIYMDKFDLNPDKLKVVPNSIFTGQYKDCVSTTSNHKTILFIGSLHKGKGVRDIIEMAKQLKDFDNIRFLIIGNGPLYEELNDEVKAHDLNVEMLGELSGEEKLAQFKRANLFILPSYFEAMPLSIIEGMASGMAVLSTPVGSVPDMVHDGREGYLHEAGDVSAFVERIQSLSYDEISEMGKYNFDHVGRYDFNQLNRNLETLYDELTS
ncbi:glycosyltransferase family 4 protein [Pontibacillus salipaludis]|uniref:Glycosyltransferase involved in cell wall biosynthesis n=1 Tax=Pontibacillus salipaludis TaxID=1697394 RepID=A0ABQ1QJP7_9BACI|nr:glycosyltransferase family 4 protein [Pontibacillus salipaludis]GGD28467.1 hypothetical protein GCM10011389_40010 [Pontibacillus salipaludis]